MIIDILTVFPEMFESPLKASLIGKAINKGLLTVNIYNIRDYTTDKHFRTDDSPFGGGVGMVMSAQPLFDLYDKILADSANEGKKPLSLYMSPQGAVLNVDMAAELSEEEHIVILCGHYEGVDQRVLDTYVDREVSIGDYVLTGGELPALVLIDAVARFVGGVLGKGESATNDSFSDGLLECPQYTRPSEYRGQRVPEVLLSGDHKKINEWRRKESLRVTLEKRPELLDHVELSKTDKKYLKEIKEEKLNSKSTEGSKDE